MLTSYCGEILVGDWSKASQALSLRLWRSMLLKSFGVSRGGMKRRNSDRSTFGGLPPVARGYVAAVVAAGVLCLVAAMLRVRLNLENILLFVTLLISGVATSAAKIELPLGRSQSNLSLSHAVNFWALFAMPPTDAVCIAAVSAWVQSTVYASGRNPLHRVLFNISSLVVTVSLAAVPLLWSGLSSDAPTAALVRAAALVAPFYFLVNSLLVALSLIHI